MLGTLGEPDTTEHQSPLRGLFEEGLIGHPIDGESFCSVTALLSSGVQFK